MLSWLWSDPLPPGTPAPQFPELAALRGRSVVLVFYPGDDTPG